MMRIRLPLSLGFGLAFALTGCGPTATEPAVTPEATGVDQPAEQKTPYLGETVKGEGGMMGGPPPAPKTEGGVSTLPPDYPAGGPDIKPKADTPEEKKADEPKADEAPKTAGVTLSDDEVATIKELGNPADVEAALAQKICLVGEDDGKPNHLGSMGKPIKVEADGKTAFVCCKGCIDEFKADPAKYFAKIGK